MHANSRNQHSQRHKSNPDLQLPKISKQPNSPRGNNQLKYEWLGRSSSYALLSTADIKQEHQYMIGEIASLQQELKKYSGVTSRVSAKPLRRSNLTNQAQNRQRQIENNTFIIIKLRNELQLLQKQASPHSKQGIDTRIQETKQKIMKTKQKIKEIKHKSRQLCDNLQNKHDYFEQTKKLQHQRDGICSRKNKLEEKVFTSEATLAKLLQKMQDIEGDAFYAQTYLQDWQQTNKHQTAQRNMQGDYRNKQYQIQILKKTIQSHKNTKQQKYHNLLKILQNQVIKLQQVDIRLQKVQIKGLYQKKQLIQYEQKSTQIDLSKSRSKTSGSFQHFRQKRHSQMHTAQKSSQISFQKIQEPIIQQPPQKQTIEKNGSQVRPSTTCICP